MDGSVEIRVDLKEGKTDGVIKSVSNKIKAFARDVNNAMNKGASVGGSSNVIENIGDDMQYAQEQAQKMADEIKSMQKLLMGAQIRQKNGTAIAGDSEILATYGDRINSLTQTYNDYVAATRRASGANVQFNDSTDEIPQHASNAGKQINHLTTRIKRLASRVLIFSVITSSLRKLRTAFSNMVAGDKELSKSLAQLRGGLYAAFAPIINGVILPVIRTLVSWLSTLVNAIASVMNAMFGTTASAGENAKALAKQAAGTKKAGSAAAKAANQIAKFDEINQMSANGGGGGSSGASGIDVSGLKNVSDIMKDIAKWALAIATAIGAWSIAKKLGADFGGIAGNLKTIAGLALTIYGLFEFIEGFVDAWKNGINELNSSKMLGGTEAIVAGLAIAFGKVGAVVGMLVTGVANVVIGIKDMITNGMNPQNVATVLRGIALILGGIALLTGNIPLAIAAAVTLVASFVVENWEKIKQWTLTMVSKVVQYFNIAKDAIIKKWNAIVEWFKDAWRQLKESTLVLCSKIVGYFKAAWSAIKTAWYAVGDFFKGIWEKITGAFSSAYTWASGVAKNIWNGLINGMKNMYAFAKRKVTSFFKNIWQGILNFFGIHSPSTVAADAGKNVLEGFAQGTENNEASITTRIKTVFSNIWEACKDVWSAVSNWFKDLFGISDNDKRNAQKAYSDIYGKGGVGRSDILNSRAISSQISDPISKGVSDSKDLLNELTTTSRKVAIDMNNAFKGMIALVSVRLSKLYEGFITNGETAVSKIETVFSGFAGYMEDTFSKAWKRVLRVFSSGGSVFKGIQNGISSVFKTVVNKLIDGLNDVLHNAFNGINKALDTIKSWKNSDGSRPFGMLPTVSISKIPKLAQGAVIPANHEFLAVLGDQKSGTNIEAPLDTIVQAMQVALGGNMGANSIAAAVKSALNGMSFKVGKTEIGHVVADAINDNRRAEGKLALNI